MSLKNLLIVQLLFGLSAFDAVLAASLPEAVCTSFTRAGTKDGAKDGTKAGVNAGAKAGIRDGTIIAGTGAGLESIELIITLSEA